MSDYDEAKHPRNHPTGASRFSEHVPGAPELTVHLLNPAPAETDGTAVYSAALTGQPVIERKPTGLSETRKALLNTRGEPNGAVRKVTLTWASVRLSSDAGPLGVAGPKDGRPLVIHLFSGKPNLHIKSGNVVILAGSHAGNRLTVEAGAHATVIAAADQKVSTTAEPGSTVELYAEAGAHGYQAVRDGANYTLHGGAGRIQLSTDTDFEFVGWASGRFA